MRFKTPHQHQLTKSRNKLNLVDESISYFVNLTKAEKNKVQIVESDFTENTNFESLVETQDIVYHLVSTTVPSTSNQHIPHEIVANVVVTSTLLEACVKKAVKKVIFISSGGTDFIYIDDAIKAIENISNSSQGPRVFNVGSGHGTSIKSVLEIVANSLDKKLQIDFLPGRKVDVPVNYLNINRYENIFGTLVAVPLSRGIIKTAEFLQINYL